MGKAEEGKNLAHELAAKQGRENDESQDVLGHLTLLESTSRLLARSSI